MDDIRRALRAWTAAASRNDIDALTAFYPPRVPVYHAWRDVTREEVGAEKRRTLDPSRVAEMDAGRAEITLGADGRTATTRVPKRDMGKGAADRGREAIQELRWIRTIDGWKIIGERELEVTSSRRAP